MGTYTKFGGLDSTTTCTNDLFNTEYNTQTIITPDS